MTATSETGDRRLRQILKSKRPDSLKLDLLTIPEDGSMRTFSQNKQVQVNVGFRNVSYTVREGIFKKGQKTVLNDVSGDFLAGELTAIMGPSGAGKSTLMNILAGYTTGNTGTLTINDEQRERALFQSQSCYIMQDDNLQPLLTVYEAMTTAANLKLPSSISRKDKQDRIKEILESLSLWNNKKVRTMCLSGGQKKRLSIALELLKNPQVMFFDEPTSGLDSLTSKQCVMLLKQMAASGRTIICTIHQPSAIIFEMFDHLYAVAGGRCAYQGSVKGLLPYLSELNLICPTYHNLADYLLEVTSGEYGDCLDALVKKSDNGLNLSWRKNQKDSMQFQSVEHVDRMMQNGRITPVKAPPIVFPKFKNEVYKETTSCCQRQYATSTFNQICVLIKRNLLIISRNKTLTYNRIATHLGIAIFIGFLYYGIGLDASNTLNNFNFLFFSVMFLMLTAFNCVSTTFPSELPIISREYFNKWYSMKSYYLAITLADIPVQVFATVLYAIVTYFMTRQPIEPHRIVSFLFMCILISLVSQSFGLLIGATMAIKNGVIFGPFCLLPFTIFSGFFVQLNDAHPSIRWLFHISFLKHGLEGLVVSVLGYDRGKMPCTEDYCHFVYPQKFLNEMDMEYAKYSTSVYFMIGLIGFIRIAAYLALLARINLKRRL